VEVKSVCKQTVCLHFELLYFLKYDVLSEYLTPFWFAMLLNIQNLGNVHIRGPHIVMSRTDAQNGLDFHFNIGVSSA
jgi:hypothetical protein